MLAIPKALNNAYDHWLTAQQVPFKEQKYYKKWLRYYQDFCDKNTLDLKDKKNFSAFNQKLVSKGQAEIQRRQAHQAITVYYGLMQANENRVEVKPIVNAVKDQQAVDDNQNYFLSVETVSVLPAMTSQSAVSSRQPSVFSVAESQQKYAVVQSSKNISWVWVYEKLSNAIKVRHYSPKTLQSYRAWVRKLQTFVQSKDAGLLDMDDVKGFLTYLAVKRKVAASTQNQAFNALLFLFRHVLEKEFEKIEGVVRAKRSRYIPVVLSREEVDIIIGLLRPPHYLVVKLLYGCGLRLLECLKLRVQDLNFDAQIITVHDGKGKKDRTVPLPSTLVVALKAQLNNAKQVYQADLKVNYAGTFLPNALDLKYKNAAREFNWQWLFPAKILTQVRGTNEFRRYHFHESHVQKAIKKASGKAMLTKRVTAHTFRHSFASHLLQAHYDITTVQALLGHASVQTTMIYLQTIPSTTLKEAKSPLDFL